MPDCGLWRAKSFFIVVRNCPSNTFNPSKFVNGSAILAVGVANFYILDASDVPKLWRAKSFFVVVRNCPSNVSNPSKFASGPKLRGRFKHLKTLHLLDYGLYTKLRTQLRKL